MIIAPMRFNPLLVSVVPLFLANILFLELVLMIRTDVRISLSKVNQQIALAPWLMYKLSILVLHPNFPLLAKPIRHSNMLLEPRPQNIKQRLLSSMSLLSLSSLTIMGPFLSQHPPSSVHSFPTSILPSSLL